jgi:hypothetical protein
MTKSLGILLAIASALIVTQPRPASAWGDEGHQVVALIAQSFLEPDVRKQVDAMLAADTDPLTAHDIASAATWADKFRDANKNGARQKTSQWHFVDIEISGPTLMRRASIIRLSRTGRSLPMDPRKIAWSIRSRNLLRSWAILQPMSKSEQSR